MTYTTAVPVTRLEFAEGFQYYGASTNLAVTATVNLPVDEIRHTPTGETLRDGQQLPAQPVTDFHVPDARANGWVTLAGHHIRGWSYDLTVTITASGHPTVLWSASVTTHRGVDVITPGMGKNTSTSGGDGGGVARERRESWADYVASWMRAEVWNARGDKFPAGAVRRIRLKKPTLETRYVVDRFTGDEDVNSTSASLSLQFLALYAAHYPHKASDVRPLVDHLASYLLSMQCKDQTQARYGGIPLALNDTSCGTLSAAQAGIGLLKAYKVYGAGEWMAGALRIGEFLRTMIDPNPKFQSLYGVNVIDVPAGTVVIGDRITSGDVFRCTATGWNLTACKFLYQLSDVTGDEQWRSLATPARDFMAPIVTQGYDYFHTKGAADGIAAGRVITNWTNQSSLDFNDNQFHRQGDALNPANGTVGTDQLEYGLTALYETGYNLAALRTAYEGWVGLINAPAASSPNFAPNYDGRICLTGYIRFNSYLYNGESRAFGSYYDAQGAGELLKWKKDQYPEHYAMSLPIVTAVLAPDAGALLDETFKTVWSVEDGGYTATQGVIPIAMSGIGLMETTDHYDKELAA